MGLLDTDKIDYIYATIDENKDITLILHMCDEWQWRDERDEPNPINKEHISLFEKKINTYLEYITTRQYEEDFPNQNIQNFMIEFFFMHKPSKAFEKEIKFFTKQLDKFKKKLKLEYMFRYMRPHDDMLKALEFYPPGRKIIVEWGKWAAAHCEIYNHDYVNRTGKKGEGCFELTLEVQKVIRNREGSGINEGGYVVISPDHRPSAIYTEKGKLIWKHK